MNAWLTYAFLWAGEPDVEVTLAVRRNEAQSTTTYTYELRWPGSRLASLSLKPSAVLGLDLMLNDCDCGVQRDSALSSQIVRKLWQQLHSLSRTILEATP